MATIPKREDAISYHPVFTFQDDLMVMESGRVVIGFDVTGIELEKLDNLQYEQLNTTFQSALKNLTPGTIFHKMDVYYNVPYVAKKEARGYFNQKIQKHFEDRKQLFHKSYCFLSFSKSEKMAQMLAINTQISALKKDLFGVLKNPLKDIEVLMANAKSGGEQFASALSTGFGIRLRQLNNQGLKQVYRQYFNQDFYFGEHEGNPRTLYRTENNISVGEQVVNMVSLSGQGGSLSDAVNNSWGVTSPFVSPLTQSLYFPHILHTAIAVEDTQVKLKSLDFTKRLNTQSNLFGNQDNVVAEAQINELTADIRANDKKLVSLKCCVSIAEGDADLRRRYIDNIISAIRSMSGAEVRVETLDTLQYFIGFAPGNVADLYNWITMPLENAVCFTHWITSYFPDRKGDILCDRYRNPLTVDFFNESGNGMNGITIGPTGSGKSFTMGYLLTQRKERGCKQIIIDNGGTYKNVVEVLQGRYMEYSLEKPLRFNPFNILKDAYGKFDLAGSDKLSFLVGLLTVLWKGREIDYDADRTGALEKLVTNYYKFINAEIEEKIMGRPSLKGFHHYVIQYIEYGEDPNTPVHIKKEFIQMTGAIDLSLFVFALERYVSEDIFGAVFAATDDEDISEHDLVCFDMARIKSNQSLEPIIGLLITQLALDQISKFPDQEKYIYIDEAWSLLNGLNEFIELMYRTSRKVGGSITIITQSIAEIAGSKICAAILQNSTNHIILNHVGPAAASLPLMQKHLGYTDHEISLIQSLGSDEKGKWREIFTKRGDNAKVFIIEAPAHMGIALSSKASERNKLIKLFRERGRMESTINQLVEDQQSSL
ncbi:VirB4 family type IV secretion system protein [Mucilaginibacter sp. UYCu711]|uniref:VirB4 family type IV secretion system protein n=1 Tax=Mucilaginibacter sp. UYCu711 TaxID=3156339 RepID=UPI003D216198